MRIFLIGFMGCGKSTLGRKLAAKLGYDLIDLDHHLEKIAGCSITTYFAEHGEESFRRLESETLKTMHYPPSCVISTGGGTPCFYDNMSWMNENGTTVYIQMNAFSLPTGEHKSDLLKNNLQLKIIKALVQAPQ